MKNMRARMQIFLKSDNIKSDEGSIRETSKMVKTYKKQEHF